jgi:hypothetical protein
LDQIRIRDPQRSRQPSVAAAEMDDQSAAYASRLNDLAGDGGVGRRDRRVRRRTEGHHSRAQSQQPDGRPDTLGK